jgi:hypothetical protein
MAPVEIALRKSLDKDDVEIVEEASQAELYLERYPLLANKSKEQLEILNKSVLKKLDWKFLPCITMMLLMKSVCQERIPH